MSSRLNSVVVTAYYQLPNSKYSHELYQSWMQNMLRGIQAPMVVFVEDDATAEKVRAIRHHFSGAGGDDLATMIRVLPMNTLLMHQYLHVWNDHWNRLDPEKNIHNPNLYMIWNEKMEFLKKAKIMIEESRSDIVPPTWYLWVDIGCFRCRPNDISRSDIQRWLNGNVDYKRLHPHKINFLQVGTWIAPERILGPTRLTIHDMSRKWASISGSTFAVPSAQVELWHARFYDMVKLFIDRDRFAGKDQTIFWNMALGYPSETHLFGAVSREQCCGGPYDPWIYFQKILDETQPKPLWYRVFVTIDAHQVSGVFTLLDRNRFQDTIRSIENQTYPMWDATVWIVYNDDTFRKGTPSRENLEWTMRRNVQESIDFACSGLRHKFSINFLDKKHLDTLPDIAARKRGCDSGDASTNVHLDYLYKSLIVPSSRILSLDHIGRLVNETYCNPLSNGWE